MTITDDDGFNPFYDRGGEDPGTERTLDEAVTRVLDRMGCKPETWAEAAEAVYADYGGFEFLKRLLAEGGAEFLPRMLAARKAAQR